MNKHYTAETFPIVWTKNNNKVQRKRKRKEIWEQHQHNEAIQI